MVASVGRITAGRGYDYLTRDIATSKHDYYTGRGEAPGVWTGRGSTLLGLGGVVDAADMAALYGRFVVPSTVGGVRQPDGRMLPEQVLGRPVSFRVRQDGTVAEPVAAFDVTFSPAKSVSLLWALSSSEQVRDAVVAAHEDAVSAALGYLDAAAGHTRAGRGGMRRVVGEGFVIAQFRHRTARSTAPGERVGDPQLHSHCAILNRVRGVDGTWRTLDSRAIYRHAHAAGALYGATLERLLSERLGVSWQTPKRRVPMREIDGIGDTLIAQFSTRRADVVATYDQLEAQWRAVHGRSPTRAEAARMFDEATVRSRNSKTGGDVDLHEQWRREVAQADLQTLACVIARQAVFDGGRLPAGSSELRDAVVVELQEQRSWWTRAHVCGEVARLVQDPSHEVIELEVERILAGCVPLEPDDDAEYACWDESKYTSPVIRDAEARVLAATTEPAGFDVAAVPDPMLGDDQVAAVEAVTEGNSRVTTIIGPAGAGKTTMLRSIAASYETAGRDVVVLTLSAAAARIVTEEAGLEASTISAWRIGQVDIGRDALVIVDEASMVPTLVLDELVRVSGAYRSRIVLLGDYAQMGAPEAGGLLRDLAASDNVVELTAVRRFRNAWEADASKQLRQRDPAAALAYLEHDRIHDTTSTTAIDEIADAWHADSRQGFSSLIVVDTAADAAEVSARCQQLRHRDRQLGERVGYAADHNPIHVGDHIQTRLNTSDLHTSDGRRVLNRDIWCVTGTTHDGTITARHLARGATVTIPPRYLAHHVTLAYATTIAGAQGRTVDRGHVLVTPRTMSAALYVGMTRGRDHNTAHVICDGHDHDEFRLGDRSAHQAFIDATRRDPDGQLSATTVRKRWEQAAAERAANRANDRHHRHITNWWQTRQQNLSPRIRTRIGPHHHRIIIATLERFTTDARRDSAVTNALSLTDWRQPDAATKFVDLLKRHTANSTPTAATAAVRHTAQRDTTR